MNTKSKVPATGRKVYIDSHSAFEEWAKSVHKFKSTTKWDIVIFKLPEFSFHENVNISTQVDEYNNACGCQSGSFFMTVTLIAIICNYFISGGMLSELTIYQIVFGIGITVLSAWIGKAIGLLNSHWNLIKLTHSIQKRLNGAYTMKPIA